MNGTAVKSPSPRWARAILQLSRGRTHGPVTRLVPEGELDKIFRAFHRADATRSEGLGLGLIVKRAADFLGHSVQVWSAIGRGACFAIVADAASPGVTITSV